MSGKRKGSASTMQAKKPKECTLKPAVDISMNPIYESDEFQKEFSRFWKGESNDLEGTSAPALAVQEPFRCCQLKDFVSDATLLDGLRRELSELELVEKNNDLYKFHQTADLSGCSAPHVRALRTLLFDRLTGWLRATTGLELTDEVDMGCSRYQYTDTLLCHDDELEGRRVAFVLYLVPSWTETDGGTLDLFDRDENGQPRAVARSLVPVNNSLVLFEVTPESFHQVSEVVTPDKVRLSVNGWLHGPGVARPPPYDEPRPPPTRPGHVQEEMLYSWINPLYLAEETQLSIRQQFEDDSEIQLDEFLLPEKYAAVSAALRENAEFEVCGPANRRRTERCRAPRPAVVEECVALLQSEAMFLILSQLTGLVLHPLAKQASKAERTENGQPGASREPEESEESESDDDEEKDGSTAAVRTEVRRWSAGCYTLVHDNDGSQREQALDARLCFQAEDWDDELGGFTSYIARGEDSELLSVSASPNSLGLVYRDCETAHFVKHINCQARAREPFYDITCAYYE